MRNPDDQPATFAADARTVFQLPTGLAKPIDLVHVKLSGETAAAARLQPGQTHLFTLQPFEAAVWESQPDPNLPRDAVRDALISDRHY